jgi:cytochrome subunit of sulfide dehydrogenase
MTRHRHYLALLACISLAALVTARVDAADTAKLSDNCALCHGKDGASTEADIPSIGGMSAEYLKLNLLQYKKKERPCPETTLRSGDKKGTKTDMCQVTKDLSDSDLGSLADLYAGKKFVRRVQKFDTELARKGKHAHQDNCEKCHSNDGSVASDDAGILAGQSMDYLRDVFKEYTAGTRPMEQKMKPKIKALQTEDFEALVNYYGSFK